MMQVGFFVLVLAMTLYGMWSVYVAIPSFGKARLIGIPFTMYQLLLGCFYLVILLEGPVTWTSYWMHWPLWLDLLLQSLAFLGFVILFVMLRRRDTFKHISFWNLVVPAFPLVGASCLKIFTRLFG